MPEGQVLEFSGVTKRFGAVTAVDGFTARVEPGRVTGFLGPNGAGKTTTLRILLGLIHATDGVATIGGVPYAKLRDPLRTVGAVLEASSFHPGRTGANHLKVYAHAAGLPDSRVDDVLGTVGLADVGGRKVGGYSLGMRQRLGLAYALLGDPGVLVLDEPANGLDPEGIKWLRGLLRELARQGRTVLVSSHLLAEVQQTVDSLVIVSRGRLVFQGALGDLTDPSEYSTVVDSTDRGALAGALRSADIETEVLRSGLVVRGVDPATVGAAAAAGGVALTLLQRRGPALEEIFLDLVNGTRVHASAAGVVAAAVPAEAAPEPEPEPVAAPEPEPEPVAAPEPEPEALGDADAPVAAEAPIDSPAEEVLNEESPDIEIVTEASTAEDGRTDAEVAAETVEAEHADTADESAVAFDAEAPAEGETSDPAAFVVASTGIIDVVPGPESEPEAQAPEAEPEAQTEAEGEPEAHETDAAPESHDAEEGAHRDSAAHGVFAVGSTGEAVETATIDVVVEEPASDSSADEASADGATGEDATDRPWEQYVKTDSDYEADRFFAAFTAEEEARAAQESAQESADDSKAGDAEGGEHR